MITYNLCERNSQLIAIDISLAIGQLKTISLNNFPRPPTPRPLGQINRYEFGPWNSPAHPLTPEGIGKLARILVREDVVEDLSCE